MVKNQRLTASLVGSCQNGTGQCPNPLYTDRYINVYFLKKMERAEVGHTRLLPLALRGRADSRIPAVYFTPSLIQ